MTSHTSSESELFRSIGGKCAACDATSIATFMRCPRDDCDFVLNQEIVIPMRGPQSDEQNTGEQR